MARGRAGDGCDVGTNMCAYIMLLTTGCCGGHHAYLGRQYQALTWSISCGGCGVGLLRDALYIPRYVRESSGEESENIRQMQLLTPKPPLSFDRVAFQAALTFTLAWVGALAALDMSASAPEARVSSALGAFLGAYLVGSIGTQECSALHTAGGTVIGAVASLAMPGYEVASVVVGALAGALATRAHRPLPQQSPCGRRGCCARFGLLGAFAATFWLAASVAVLQHGTMTVGDPPAPVKLGEYVRENWSEWAELYREVNEHLKNSGQTWGDLFGEVLDRVTSSDDKHFTTLELEPGASWDEVKKAYKRMARKYHPDKVRGGEEEVAAAAEKFMAAQKAYEALGVSMGQSRKAAAAAEEEKATRFQGFSAGSRASNDPPKSTKQPRKPRKSKRRRPKSEL